MRLETARGGTGLRKVILRGARVDPLRARQRLELALATVDWTPPDLPPRALLFVRRLAVAPGMARGFGQLVSDALRQRSAAARRPWLDPAAGAADAVVFADEAELVACLVRDWLRHRVADRWWWREVLGAASTEEWLRTHALPKGDVLAPALARLDPHSEAVAWAARLSDAEACVAATAVERAFALTAAEPRMQPMPFVVARERNRADTPQDSLQAGAAPTRRASLARLFAAVPEALSTRLGRPQRRLLATALVVMRVPSWARTIECAEALAAIDDEHLDFDEVHAIEPVADPRTPDATRRPAPPQSHPVPPANGIVVPPQAAAPVVGGTELDVMAADSSREPSAAPPLAPMTVVHDQPPRLVDGAAADPSTDVSGSAPVQDSPALAASLPLGSDQSIVTHLDELPGLEPLAPLRVEDRLEPRIETAFGGLFYLLNAWLAMGVYADFTAPRGPNLPLSPWDLLALVGRAWFGAPLATDPIWALLAELAGRGPDDEPGHDVALPDGWLVEHLETLTARLRQALGGEGAMDVPAIIGRHHARVGVTTASVDVHLVLAALPIEIRIAGLDRDPGWIPAAGRAVAFHFD